MNDWPDHAPPTLIVSPHTREALGTSLAITSGAVAAWPSANLALFIPFALARPTLFVTMGSDNGTTVSGNIDVGIYDWTGRRIVSSGSTAQAGTSAIQLFNIADTLIGPGKFYLAVAMDNTTGTLVRATNPMGANQEFGILEMASAFPLPATATFAASARSYIPQFAASTKAVI